MKNLTKGELAVAAIVVGIIVVGACFIAQVVKYNPNIYWM